MVAASNAAAFNVDRRDGSNAAFCSKVKKLVTAAGQQAGATSFCQSYVGAVVSPTVSTTTMTVPTTITQTQQTVTTEINTVYRTPAGCVAPGASPVGKRELNKRQYAIEHDFSVPKAERRDVEVQAVERRGKTPVNKPTCLSTYNPGATLSSACNCLGISKTTSKSTSTTTVTKISGTSTTTVTSTSTTSTTTTMVSGVAPIPDQFYIVASGGPGSGKYAAVDGMHVTFTSNGPGSLFDLRDNSYLNAPNESDNDARIPDPNLTLGSSPGPVTFSSDRGNLVRCSYIFNDDGTCELDCNQAYLSRVDSVCGGDNQWNLGDSVCDGGTAFTPYAVAV